MEQGKGRNENLEREGLIVLIVQGRFLILHVYFEKGVAGLKQVAWRKKDHVHVLVLGFFLLLFFPLIQVCCASLLLSRSA